MDRTYIIRRVVDATVTQPSGVIEPGRSHQPIARVVAASREVATAIAANKFPGVQLDLSCPGERKLHLFATLPTI